MARHKKQWFTMWYRTERAREDGYQTALRGGGMTGGFRVNRVVERVER